MSDQLYEERIEVCKTCEEYREWFCDHCKCILPVKARIESSNCPLNKWKN